MKIESEYCNRAEAVSNHTVNSTKRLFHVKDSHAFFTIKFSKK